MKFNLFLICSLLLFSCIGKQEKKEIKKSEYTLELPVIKIQPPPKNLKPIFLSEIADSIHYVALETNKNCLLSYAYGNIINSGFIFFQTPILYFSSEGKFINKIGSIGGGPEEYLPTAGTIVENLNNIIYVRDRGHLNDYVKYSIDGKYIGRIKRDFLGDGMRATYIDSAIIMIYPPMDSRLKQFPDILVYNPIIDSLTAVKTINYGISQNGNIHFEISGSTCFSVHPKYLYYKTTYCDTLYFITKNEIKPIMIIDFGKYVYSKENIYGGSYKDYKELLRNTIRLNAMRRIEERFYFSCVYTNNDDVKISFIYVCDLNGNNGSYYKSPFINDLDDGPDFYFPTIGNITSITKGDIDEDNRKFYFPNHKISKKMEKTDEFIELFNRVDENDNPIIQVIHFKK